VVPAPFLSIRSNIDSIAWKPILS